VPSDTLPPILGDPVAVGAAARTFASIAADIAATATRLRALAAGDGTWTGVAATRAQARAATLPPKLDKATASYAAAGGALRDYAVALADAQRQSASAIAAERRASLDLESARAAQATATQHDAAQAATAHAAGQLAPPPTAQRHQADIDDAAARVARASATNRAAHDDQSRAARLAAAALKEASREGIHNQSWWRHAISSAANWASTQWAQALRTVSKVAATISGLAGIAALALSIAGVFFPPLEGAAATLEAISLVSAQLSVIADATLAASGKGSWTTVGLDALNLAPAALGKIIGKAAPALRRILNSDRLTGVEHVDSHMGGFTEAGSIVRHTKTATAIGDDDATLANLSRSTGAEGHDVIVHGVLIDDEAYFSADQTLIHPQQVADAILSNPEYSGGPINLVSCYGAKGTAAELEDILGVPVNAKMGRVRLNPKTGALEESVGR